jgi:hypothetical protein
VVQVTLSDLLVSFRRAVVRPTEQSYRRLGLLLGDQDAAEKAHALATVAAAKVAVTQGKPYLEVVDLYVQVLHARANR